jgi:hypothetical protein
LCEQKIIDYLLTMIEKRGTSPIVGTTILVVIVVAGVLILTFWGRGFLKDIQEKGGVDVEKLDCNLIDIDASDTGGSVRLANRGTDLSGVAIHVLGDESPQSFVYPQEIKRGSSKTYSYQDMPGFNTIKKLSVIPLLGRGINRPCSDQRIELKL